MGLPHDPTDISSQEETLVRILSVLSPVDIINSKVIFHALLAEDRGSLTYELAAGSFFHRVSRARYCGRLLAAGPAFIQSSSRSARRRTHCRHFFPEDYFVFPNALW
jgi:hypothetical protein